MGQYICGRNTVMMRLEKDGDIEEILLQDGFKDSKILSMVRNYPVKYVKKDKLDRLTNGANHQGVVVKVKTYEYIPLDAILKKIPANKTPLLVMLDGIEDPHNLGAILRTCDAIGVDGVIVPKRGSAPLNTTVAKVSTGAIEYVKVAAVTNLVRCVEDLKKQGYWIVGAEATNAVDYRSVDYNMPTVLVIGSEGKGISRLLGEKCDFRVALPMVGHVNSLNASVATAILLYQIHSHRFPV